MKNNETFGIDTVYMNCPAIIDTDKLNKLFSSDINIKRKIETNKNGEVTSELYIIKDDKVQTIKYNPNWNRIIIHCSVSKVLYGENIKEININDIDEFFNLLHNKLYKLFNIHINTEMWQVSRIDIFKNYIFNTQLELDTYITKLSKIKLNRKNTTIFNSCVLYKNKSQEIKLYDKGKEANIKDVCILRFEVKNTKNILRDFDQVRLAINILTSKFFNHIMQRQLEEINNKLELLSDTSEFDLDVFNINKVATIEKIYSFLAFLEMFGETKVKHIYQYQNYRNRVKLVNEFSDNISRNSKFRLKI